MNIALVGYGKMGRMIETLARDEGVRVGLVLDVEQNQKGEGIRRERFEGIDAAIEFTTPEAAPANLEALAMVGVPVVCGSTGWLASLPRVKQAFEAKGGALVWSANFSIGVNVFQKLAEEAARLMAAQDGYGAWAWEMHHAAKMDAPSGTLLALVEAMKRAGYGKAVDVSSSRAGFVPGTHEIGFDSAVDTITLRHTARSREGFARGALHAARWVVGKKGVHEFKDILFASGKEKT